MDFTFISDKISSWLDACDRLERVLAGVKDKVLKKWKERLLVYKGVIPLFIELSSKALKVQLSVCVHVHIVAKLELTVEFESVIS